MRIKNVVKVMNFHSLLRVDASKREAEAYRNVGEEITKIIKNIVYNKNLVLDKKVITPDPKMDKLNIYIANDYGFCGNFNSQVARQIKQDKNDYKIIIGKKIIYHDDKTILKIEKDKFYKEFNKIEKAVNDAIDNDIIIKNVASNIKPLKVIKNERMPLTIDEDNLLINSTHKYAPFFILMRYTGMRKEEIIPLTVDDVDLKNKTISINKAVVLLHNQPIVKTTKNNRVRTIPILDNIYDIVVNLVNNSKNGLLFVKEKDGKMLTDVAVRRHLESFLYSINKNKENNIKFTCHQLRHSYCTMLYYAGVKIKKAQALMGHASASMIYEVYTHLDEQRENADDLINNYIKNCVN